MFRSSLISLRRMRARCTLRNDRTAASPPIRIPTDPDAPAVPADTAGAAPCGITLPAALIAPFALQPHPQGGWYRELHRSACQVQRSEDGRQRAGLTVILFLLTEGQRSGWQRGAGGDEVWHDAGGDPLDLWRLPPQGGGR